MQPQTAIYAVGRLAPWKDIIIRLHTVYDYTPGYVIAHPELVSSLNNKYDNFIFESTYDVTKGIFSGKIDISEYPIDADVLKQYQTCERHAIRMMNRMDLGNSFSYNERKRLYRRLLYYCLHIVRETDPDVAVFELTPHTPARYILYHVCIKSSVDILIFTPTRVRNIFYLRKRILDSSQVLEAEYSEALNKRNLEISEQSAEHLDTVRKDYEQARPDFMKELRISTKTDRLLKGDSKIKKPLKKLRQYVKRIRKRNIEYENNYYKKEGIRPEDSKLSYGDKKAYRQRANRYKTKLKRRYEKLSESPSYSEQYVFVPLHYQPERTTLPEGGEYVDQTVMVNLLASAVPEDWRLYIKEHPSQFSPELNGEQGRVLHEYFDLDNINKVQLVNFDSNPFRLIDDSEAVATVTGTAGWESVVRGTPAIVFGNPWYRPCNGVFPVRDTDDLLDALQHTSGDYSVDPEDIKRFVFALEEVGFSLPFAVDHESSEEVVAEYSDLISSWFEGT